MNAETGMELPPGTAVYCCARGMVLDLVWHSPIGMHIVRLEVPLALTQPAQRALLSEAVRDFRHAVALERARV